MQGIAQKILANPSKYSVQELTQGVQNGIIPAYIGIPLIQEKMQAEKEKQAMMAGQGQAQQPPVAEQVLQEANAIAQLPSNLPGQYAHGGIVAFASGGVPTPDRSMIKALLGEEGDESEEDLDELVDAYSSPLRLPRATEEGIAALAPQKAEGASSLQYMGTEQSSKVGDEPKRTHGEGIQTLTRESKDPNKLLQHVLFKESRGQRYDKEGKLLTSSKGAMGEMQVMPSTARDPGFGVAPARSNDPDEIARVGRDVLSAMLNRYGDPKLAAIAYNWGPGNTDKWLAAGADPSKLPRETRGYIEGLAKGGKVERFQGLNNSLVRLDNEDYTSIPGLVAGTIFEDQMRRAKGLPTRAEEAEAKRARKMLPGAMERMTAPMDFLEIPGMVTGTPFADAMRTIPTARPAAAAEPGRAQLAPANPQRNNPMSVTGPGDARWGRDMGTENPNPAGPAATPDMMKRIEALGGQLDAARADVQNLMKSRPGLRSAGLPDWQEKFDAASARRSALQSQYEKLMEATGMNQAAFGVFGGALSPTQRKPNEMVQAMGAGQVPPKAPVKTPTAPAGGAAAPATAALGSPLASAGVSEADLDAAIKSFEGVTSQAGAPAAAAAAQAPGAAPAPSGYDKIMEMLASREAGLKDQATQDKYMALLQAGLGMMAGTSPHAAANIGAGAMQGVNTYAALSKMRGDEAKNILSGQLMAERYRGLEDYRKMQQEGLAEYRKSETERKTAAAGAATEAKKTGQLAAMEKAAVGQALAAMKLNPLENMDASGADIQARAQAYAQGQLMKSPAYRKLYKDVYGFDPSEGFGSTGAGGAPTISWGDFTKKGK